MSVGASELDRILANRGHALLIFGGSLERCEKSIAHFGGPLQRRFRTASHPDVHRAEVVVGARDGTRLNRDIVEIEEASVEARVLLAPYLAQHLDALFQPLAAPLGGDSARG